MYDTAYPLAQTDRAYAFEGVYRAPETLSAAARAAYGIRPPVSRNGLPTFREALCAATSAPRAHTSLAVGRGIACAAVRRQPPQSGTPRSRRRPNCGAEPAMWVLCTQRRPVAPAREAASVYYLVVSSPGCVVRALVVRGRAFVGGIRTCPTSMR